MLKAIETVYNGYRFRSRLEARWAVFFDTLGIKYEYEKEGYDLGGTWYLPDFWLPELDCWIEIKGKNPTDDEWDKLAKLALYTGKNALIASGDCWPSNAGGAAFIGVEGVNAFAGYNNSIVKHLDMPRDLVVVLRKIWLYGIRVSISKTRKRKEIGNGLYVNTSEWFRGATFESALQDIEEQYKNLPHLFAVLSESVDELFALIPDRPPCIQDGFTFEIEGGGSIVDAEWRVCLQCNEVNLVEPNESCRNCGGICDPDEDRFLEAYTAARQARFEH